jgi:trimethylamine--corrinoid protein Co-methyltransferase
MTAAKGRAATGGGGAAAAPRAEAAPRARISVWGAPECERLHAASLEILERCGVEVKHPRGLELLAGAGARVAGTRVRIPAGVVATALASAPRSWTVHGRVDDDSLDIVLEDGRTYFGSGPDCLYTRDSRNGERRRATLDDVEQTAALAERLPNIDFVMSMGLPVDAATETVDLAQFAAMVKGSRKPIVVSSPFGGESMRAMRGMAELCGRGDSLACLTMTSPPLSVDDVAVSKALVCGELSIPLVLAPAPSAGSTAPASVAAVIAVANAEVLAGLCIHQLAHPGAPFVYGAGVGIINMRTTVEAYCSPESSLGHQAMVDLARHYGLPSWSYAGDSDAKSLDEQWSSEATASTVFGGLSRATLLHDVGYLESGLQSSYDSLVFGDELAGFVRRFMADLTVDDDALQLEAIIAAGPGGNHLGTRHTRRHYRDFWQPGVFDQNTFDHWRADGSRTLADRVRVRTLDLLDAPRTFAVPADVSTRLDEIVATAQRRATGD